VLTLYEKKHPEKNIMECRGEGDGKGNVSKGGKLSMSGSMWLRLKSSSVEKEKKKRKFLCETSSFRGDISSSGRVERCGGEDPIY